MTLSPVRALRPVLLATGAAAVLAVSVAGPASAHVTVHADDSRPGTTDSVLTFRVPNEEAKASTVKVAISFPARNPLPSVLPEAKPGWTISTVNSTFNPPITTDDGTITNGVTQVTYTATSTSAGIAVGDFATFQILVGPLPARATTLAFPTLQTYSDGKVVSWIQPITDPANEPDFPTPTLQVAAEPDAAAAPLASTGGSAPSAAPTSADDPTARALGVAGIVVGALGLLGGVGVAVRARRRVP